MTKKAKAAEVVAAKPDAMTADKADPKPAPKLVSAKSAKLSKAPRRAKTSAHKTSKQAKVLEMLRRAGGVTIPQIMDATGWQQHSVRGFLSGAIKKKLGIKVLSDKDKNGTRIYRVKAA